MEYSFEDENWSESRDWIYWFCRLGYEAYARKCAGKQFIYIIVVPAESICPLLVALGAMRKDIEKEDSSDLCKHFEELKTNRNKLIVLNNSRSKFKFINYDEKKNMVLYESVNIGKDGTNPEIRKITLMASANYHFENEAPVEIKYDDKKKYEKLEDAIEIIEKLVPDADGRIIKENFFRKHSAIWLAGSKRGEENSKRLAINFKLRKSENDQIMSLSDLSFIEGWSGHCIQRVKYFNPRVDGQNSNTTDASLIITENENAFLSLIDRIEFENTDFICFFPVTSEIEEIDMFMDKIKSLMQWYDFSPLYLQDSAPKGITIFALEKRGA